MYTDRSTDDETEVDIKEVSEMAVLAKPVNASFELDSKKADSFFSVSKKKLFEKAIARSEAHIKNANDNKGK